jgi:hypothetical protein
MRRFFRELGPAKIEMLLYAVFFCLVVTGYWFLGWMLVAVSCAGFLAGWASIRSRRWHRDFRNRRY